MTCGTDSSPEGAFFLISNEERLGRGKSGIYFFLAGSVGLDSAAVCIGISSLVLRDVLKPFFSVFAIVLNAVETRTSTAIALQSIEGGFTDVEFVAGLS
jgi:hypothetical protein